MPPSGLAPIALPFILGAVAGIFKGKHSRNAESQIIWVNDPE
jgi:hypothetical protein